MGIRDYHGWLVASESVRFHHISQAIPAEGEACLVLSVLHWHVKEAHYTGDEGRRSLENIPYFVPHLIER
jgi:hypothetical protein